MTTPIFSGLQLREVKIRTHARFTVRTKIGPSDAPLFEPPYQPDAARLFSQVEDRHHQFRHWIVQIEEHLRSQYLRHQGTHHENVRHVVDVDQVITPPETSAGPRMIAQIRMKAE